MLGFTHYRLQTNVDGTFGQQVPIGPQGSTGPQGSQGATGKAGPKGDKGDQAVEIDIMAESCKH